MRALIEMSAGTFDKSEVCKETGLIRVDRQLAVRCPYNYGFLKDTLAQDGDALDVFVLGNCLDQLAELDVVLVGVFLCTDGGVPDHKILAVPAGQGTAVFQHEVDAVREYLSTYKQGFKVLAYTDNVLAVMRVIRSCRLHRAGRQPHAMLDLRFLLVLIILASLLALTF